MTTPDRLRVSLWVSPSLSYALCQLSGQGYGLWRYVSEDAGFWAARELRFQTLPHPLDRPESVDRPVSAVRDMGFCRAAAGEDTEDT